MQGLETSSRNEKVLKRRYQQICICLDRALYNGECKRATVHLKQQELSGYIICSLLSGGFAIEETDTVPVSSIAKPPDNCNYYDIRTTYVTVITITIMYFAVMMLFGSIL